MKDIEWIETTVKQISKQWGFIISYNGKYIIDGEELIDMWVGLDDI